MADLKVVSASPVKSFFVQMLTRDIELADAILDLLDNCIDGVLRMAGKGCDNPYSNHSIDIEMSPLAFIISDDCGGIPLNILKTYAFRMGREPTMPKDAVATVGTFGIGMKRAIFKMGTRCEVLTHSKQDSDAGQKRVCKVAITPDWVRDEKNWDIPYELVSESKYKEFGTRIKISDLNESTRKEFNCERSSFDEKMRQQIAVTYGFMISKGLRISVNGKQVSSVPMMLKCGGDVAPYVYKCKMGNVDVFLAIGITTPLAEGDGTPEDGGSVKYSAQSAGWTVMCNDRVVLYADKSILTGWGEAGVPQFHPQYNSISGIVAFNSNDVRALPTTTTKRGVDAANPVYLAVKNFMREGTKACVKFTNDWKRRESEVRDKISTVRSVPFQKMKEGEDARSPINYVKMGKGLPGFVSKAKLPTPHRVDAVKSLCSLSIEKSKLHVVADYLGLSSASARVVVQAAFDHVYEEAIES